MLQSALAALGPGATARELGLVADTLRASGDKATLKVLGAAADDQKAFEALCAVAAEAGSSGFVALDLVVAFTSGVPQTRGGPAEALRKGLERL